MYTNSKATVLRVKWRWIALQLSQGYRGGK